MARLGCRAVGLKAEGIYRGEVIAMMAALKRIEEKLTLVLAALEGEDDGDEEDPA